MYLSNALVSATLYTAGPFIHRHENLFPNAHKSQCRKVLVSLSAHIHSANILFVRMHLSHITTYFSAVSKSALDFVPIYNLYQKMSIPET